MTNSNAFVKPFESGRSRAKVVSILLVLSMVVDLIAISLSYSQLSLLSQVAAGQQITPEEAAANDGRMQAAGILQLLVYIVTAICFLVWIHRAHRNLPALGAHNLEYSPGWAVGGFFVPFLNLVRPYQVVREIWKASSPDVDISDGVSWRYADTAPLLGFWWGAWLVSNILGQAVFRLASSAETVDSFINLTWLGIVADVVSILATVLVLLVIRKIDARQEEKFSRLAGLGSASGDIAFGPDA